MPLVLLRQGIGGKGEGKVRREVRRQLSVQGGAHTSCVYKNKVQRHHCGHAVFHPAIESNSHWATIVAADMYADCRYVQFLALQKQ